MIKARIAQIYLSSLQCIKLQLECKTSLQVHRDSAAKCSPRHSETETPIYMFIVYSIEKRLKIYVEIKTQIESNIEIIDSFSALRQCPINA